MERDFSKEAVKCGERCILVVDTSAIKKNAGFIIKKTGKKLIAVVKADGYGQGLEETVKALKKTASLFAVATAEEALAVAETGEKALILSPVTEKELKEIAGKDISVSVSDKESARAAAESGLDVHIAVNTGMNRYGADCRDIGTLLEICDAADKRLKGIYTHFACADKEDISVTLESEKRFSAVVNVLGKRRFEYIHSANSAAALRTECTGNAVRAGLALYGISPDLCNAPLAEVSRFYARITHIRLLKDGDALGYCNGYVASGVKRIAVIGAGYADGLPYALKKYGAVLINGTICNIVGNVCMDCAFVDVTYARVQEGDYALVFGGQGEMSYRAQARKCDTIPYELVTGISRRVRRVYLA